MHGRQGIVVVGGDEHHDLSGLDGRQHLLGHQPAIEAAFLLGIVDAGDEVTALAVHDAAVLNVQGGDAALGQVALDPLPQHQRIGCAVGAGVEGQNAAAAARRRIGHEPLEKPAALLRPDLLQTHLQGLLPGPEVSQALQALHHAVAGKPAAHAVCQVHHRLSGPLGEKLIGAGYQQHPFGARQGVLPVPAPQRQQLAVQGLAPPQRIQLSQKDELSVPAVRQGRSGADPQGSGGQAGLAHGRHGRTRRGSPEHCKGLQKELLRIISVSRSRSCRAEGRFRHSVS